VGDDYLHSAPRDRDWVHVDDLIREARLVGVSADLRLALYEDLGLLRTVRVVGGQGYYLLVDGYDFAMEAGPDEMRKLFAALEASARLRLEAGAGAGVGSIGEED
jgi:hypothetical protein